MISQRGKIPPEEGPSHFGSQAAAARGDPTGEAPRRTLTRREASPQSAASRKACRAVTVTRETGPRRSRAQTDRAKATDGTKSLDAQCPRTSRRRGRGMWTGLIRELERPSRARRRSSRVGDGARISRTRSRCSARRASDGVVVPRMAVQDNAVGGKDPCFVHVSVAGKRG